MRILTNGHMLASSSFALRSIKQWLQSYHISLHSHIESIHDAMVKKPWSYRRSLEAMKNIIKSWWSLTINITINSYNVKYFPKMILFFIKNFPQIEGFIVNNLETSQITNKYFWVIADLKDIKEIIIPTLKIIEESWKEVRVERVPMCYMRWYEHLSVDVEYTILGDEKYLHYLDDTTVSGVLDSSTHSADYTYWQACKWCDLQKICSGIVGVGTHYKEEDLFTQKVSEQEIELIITLSKKYLQRIV
jgi:MoaA/NifB/PqqE/SkfB family radical SAM enzyme